MKTIKKKTVSSLLTLIKEGQVNAGGIFEDELFTMLMNAGAVTRSREGKGRYVYHLSNENRLRLLCKEYDTRLTYIEGYNELLTNKAILTPAQQAELFSGNDKYAKRQLWEGFFLKADTRTEVHYNNNNTFVDDRLPILIEDTENLILPNDKKVIIVENYQCFHSLKWMKKVKAPTNSFIICRWPQTVRQREYLSSITNEKFYFGDMDLAGINIYLTEYSSFIPYDNFLIPDDYKEKIKQGSKDLFIKQEAKFKGLTCKDLRIQSLIDEIRNNQKSYIQESYLI